MVSFKNVTIGGMITAVILLVMLFTVASEGLPLINTAGDDLCATGIPFASFFKSNGLVMLAIAGAVLLGVISYLGYKTAR